MVAFFFQMLLAGYVVVYFYAKLFAAVDTDGELKKTASQSFLSWLDRRLK
jgi:hypothetical protein